MHRPVLPDRSVDAVPRSLPYRCLVVLTAAAIPSVVFGPAAVGVVLVVALLMYVPMAERRDSVAHLRTAVTTPASLLVLFVFLAWLPNVFLSPEPLRSLEAVARTLLYVGAAAVLWSALCNGAGFWAVQLLAAFAAVAAVISLVSVLISPELLSLLRDGVWTEVDAALWLKPVASAMVLLIPCMPLATRKRERAWTSLATLTVVGLVCLMVLTVTRSAIAGTITMGVAWACLTMLRQRRVGWALLVGMLAFAIVAAAIGWLYVTRSGMSDMGVDLFAPEWLIDPHRQAIWQYAWQLGEGHRWFGTGANAIDRLPESVKHMHLPGTSAEWLPSHPHNWVIEIAVETGFLGLVALLALIVAILVRLVRDYLVHGDAAVLATILVWTGFWSSGMFNFSFWSSWWQASFLVITAICLAARRDRPEAHDPASLSRGSRTP